MSFSWKWRKLKDTLLQSHRIFSDTSYLNKIHRCKYVRLVSYFCLLKIDLPDEFKYYIICAGLKRCTCVWIKTSLYKKCMYTETGILVTLEYYTFLVQKVYWRFEHFETKTQILYTGSWKILHIFVFDTF